MFPKAKVICTKWLCFQRRRLFWCSNILIQFDGSIHFAWPEKIIQVNGLECLLFIEQKEDSRFFWNSKLNGNVRETLSNFKLWNLFSILPSFSFANVKCPNTILFQVKPEIEELSSQFSLENIWRLHGKKCDFLVWNPILSPSKNCNSFF